MDQTKFVPEHLKKQTLRKLSRHIETGAARAVPVFVGGRWATQVVRRRRRNLQLSVPQGAVAPAAALFALALLLVAGPAAALVSHWESRSLSLTGPEAVLLYKSLNAPEVVSNGGFRQPSKMKAAVFGPFTVFCDTHAAPVCTVSWPEAAGAHVYAGVADMGGVAPCRSDVTAQSREASFTCMPEGIAVLRRAK